MEKRDFNHIKEWLEPLLAKRGLSAEKFARLCGLSRASVYFYMNDCSRPTEETMATMCKVLGVPYSQGLSQYTPKQNGRPSGRR